jgi:hypothetical protein
MTGVESVVAVGTVIASGDGSALVPTVSAEGSVGEVETSGKANVTLSGAVSISTAQPVLAVVSGPIINLTGLTATSGITSPTVYPQTKITLAGVSVASSVGTATVRLTNTPPAWTAETPSSLGTYAFGTGGTYSLAPFDFDADGDPVEFYRSGSAADTAPASVTVSTAGLVTVPSSLPAAGHSIGVRLWDGAAFSDSHTFTFSVVAPTESVTHGELFTITAGATPFGTRPDYNYAGLTWEGHSHLHYLWCDFSEGEPAAYTTAGWSARLGGIIPRWFNPQGVNEVVPAIGTNGNLSGRYQTGPSANGWCWRRYPNTNTNRNGGLYLPNGGPIFASGFTGEYSSYKFKYNGPVETVSGNCKIYRRGYNFPSKEYYHWFESAPIQAAAGTGAWEPPLSTFTASSLRGGTYTTSVWHRHELDTRVDNVTAGTVRFRLDNVNRYFDNSGTPDPGFLDVPVIPSSMTVFGPASRGTPTSGQYNFTLCSESGYNAAYTQDVTDIYYDLTKARVEITQGSISEVQLVNSWANTSITIIGNKGQLSSGAATLKVYNASDTVIHTQSVTVQ